ncbi:serine/threonine-protein kinase [Atlantibacter sp.]|uniref:serine/threonine-protein kinase n=1 Tax=Atlantibacter sp. TaxID=1903473 RepID=UPI0028A670B9|nr:serine/threonine-protein kinase [Atlantibacter sp.]
MITPYQKADVSFKFKEEIGLEGRNSKVYLAHDEHLDHEIVIKQVEQKSIEPDEFFQEARLLYASAHSNIVQICYAAKDDNNIYIAMPFYSNGSLSSLMAKKHLTSREIIRYAVQFLSGLNHIHSKGLMHFDIKPNNIMLSDRDEALLSDFGLSAIIDADGFSAISKFYTTHVPPEIFSQNRFNFTYDIYQSGMTLYRMAVGDEFFKNAADTFFSDTDKDRLHASFARGDFPPKTYPVHIHPTLVKIINKCLHPNPNDRYQSVLSIINDLAKISDGCLDWRLVNEDDNGKILWIKPVDGANLHLTLDPESNTTDCRKVYSDGKSRKLSSHCVDVTSNKVMYRLMKS